MAKKSPGKKPSNTAPGAKLTRVAFLRAINVGGHRVTNDELTEVVMPLGFAAVTAYQASGNLLLADSPASAANDSQQTEGAIEQALESAFGYAVPTMIRSAVEIKAIATATPFPAEVLAKTGGKVQVMFFKTELSDDQQTTALAIATPDDRIVVDGAEVYWLPTEGISTSSVKVNALNKAIGPITIRTQATIGRIAKKLA